MFDTLDLPETPVLSDLDDTDLIDGLTAWTRLEALCAARRLAHIAAVVARHCDDEDDGSAHCAIDGWESAAAQVSAACNLGRRAASTQMRIAQALDGGLPKVGGLLTDGRISAKTAAAITWRTQLVTDTEALALIDTALAAAATTFGSLSTAKCEQAIDVWIDKFDPAAVRRTRTAARERDVTFGSDDDTGGLTGIWGRLLATDAALLKARLTAMTHDVCHDDPRTMGQRRADALGALGAGADRLTCQCGALDCPAAGDADPRSTRVTIYVLAEHPPQPAHPEPAPEPGNPDPGAPRDPHLHGDPDLTRHEPPPTVTGSAAVLLGGAILPAPLLAELIATGAKVTHLTDIDELPAEPHYRPSTKLAAYIRMRAMTCMFPGCHQAAHHCDLDHVIPWPAGPTHPGNLGPLCRAHHLLKTFTGWGNTQHPDGAHTWTAPSGHTYTTAPVSRILFPHWNIHTPAPPSPTGSTEPGHPANRGLMMPKRRRTRAQDRTQRIKTERALNDAYLAERNRPPDF